MPLGQGWLNAWVKVNNKHVVYNRTEGESGQAPAGSTKQIKTSKTTTSAKTSRTAITENVETQAIRRVNSRKNKRRLHRTISASDLIRDQAKSLSGNIGGCSTLDVGTMALPVIEHSARSSSQPDMPSPAASRKQIGDRSGNFYDAEESLRFMNELFGTDIDSFHRLEPPSTGDQVLDLDNGLWPWATRPQQPPADTASIPSSNGTSARPSGGSTVRTSSRSEADENPSVKGGFRFPPNLFSGDNSKARCEQCAKLENELAVLQDDLEYIRAVALRNEYVCSSCSTESVSHPPESQSAFHLKANERLLDEVTARHKAQLEQLTKDRQRWQHDAHVKLQKYAALCKDLNEEATLRNEEVISLHKELDSVRLERDQMSGELELARANIANHERDALERKKLDERLQQYESRGLDEAEHAIKTRDLVIADLSYRLEKTLDILELEREQQRQRRQIIFPIQRSSVPNDQGDLAEELRNTKARLSDVQAELHALQRLTEHKEAEWMSQIGAFGEELNGRRGETLQRHRKLPVDIQS